MQSIFSYVLIGIGAIYLIALLMNWFEPLPEYHVKGSVNIVPLILSRQAVERSNEWRSEDCGVNLTRSNEICIEEKVVDFALSIRSANCGSGVRLVKSNRENCIVAEESLMGCGYKRILGIKECKGRGWLSYSATLTSEKIQEGDPTVFVIDRKIESIEEFDLRMEGGKSDVLFKWSLNISEGGKGIALLNEERPSAAGFASQIINGRLVVSRLDQDS